jgi:DNA-binding MarR family transcriptional regulator
MNRKKSIEDIFESFGAVRRKTMAAGNKFGHNFGLNITNSQWVALHLIHQHGIDNITDIAKTMTITSSAATQLVDSLADNGLILRKENREDRRATTLVLSKKAKDQFNAMRSKGLSHISKFFTVLTDTELETLSKLIKKIISGIK